MKSILFICFFQCFLLMTTIAQVTLVVGNQTTTVGNTVSIPVHIESTQAVDIAGFQFAITWDATVLEYQSLSNYGISSFDADDFGTPDMTGTNNQIIVTWEEYPDLFSVDGQGHLFNINFTVNENLSDASTDISTCTSCVSTEFYDQNVELLTTAVQNGYVIVSSLPIELLQFNAQAIKNKTAQLSWLTATETNNSHFEIERSIDTKNWQMLAKISGKGTSTTQQNYEYLDQRPIKGQNFYRLKQVDLNGDYEYSNIEIVDIEKETGIISWTNPVKDKLYISYEAIQNKDIVFDIYSSDGKLIEHQVFKVVAGQNNLIWDVHHLANGLYWIKNKSEETAAFKVIKQ